MGGEHGRHGKDRKSTEFIVPVIPAKAGIYNSQKPTFPISVNPARTFFTNRFRHQYLPTNHASANIGLC
jgi:hypothetical protein